MRKAAAIRLPHGFSDGSTRTEVSLFAFDSTGLKPTNRGDWMTEKWGHEGRGFIKLHVGVDTRTKKIYAVVITDDKCGDSHSLRSW